MSAFSVCPAGPAESALLAALQTDAFQNDPQAGEIWDAVAIGEILGLPGAFGLLAARENLPAGFLLGRVAADEAEILALGVLPACRRQGAAGALIRAARQRAEAAGGQRLFLEVAEDNPVACKFYFSQGFQQVGTRPAYYKRPGRPRAGARILACPLPFV